jgi:glycosyltransferase involved in cell wall biosynthesis
MPLDSATRSRIYSGLSPVRACGRTPQPRTPPPTNQPPIMTTKISIGLLAYNEAQKLPKTLASLRQQTIFYLTETQYQVEVVIVPNGCTDATTTIAEQIFAHPEWQDLDDRVTCQVRPIAEAGKSHAWNCYIHELANRDTDYFVLMDADIVFGEPETIAYLVQQLTNDAKAWIAIDQPIKHVQLRLQTGAIESMSAQVSVEDVSQGKGITGQLYAARAHKLRQIWMPKGLAVEDGFLRAMILTDRFTVPEDFDRIVFTPGASHVYEAYIGIRALLRHEKRIMVGTIVNQFIFDYLWATCNRKLDAGTLIRRQNERDPEWLRQLIQESAKTRGWWLLHPSHTFRRFSALKQTPSDWEKFQRLPITIAASIADWAVFWRANRAVRQGQGLGYW